jgi:hypothetical protein
MLVITVPIWFFPLLLFKILSKRHGTHERRVFIKGEVFLWE